MKLSESVRGQLRLFAFYLANRSLAPDVLSGIEYGWLLDEPSCVELVFAIWSNVIDLDKDGNATNAARADHRAAQYLRSYADPGYIVEPPFEEWEVQLHL